MNDAIKELAELTKAIEQEKNIDLALDQFIHGAQVVKGLLKAIDQAEGKLYEVVDDVEKVMEE